jgi:hypothetical protein
MYDFRSERWNEFDLPKLLARASGPGPASWKPSCGSKETVVVHLLAHVNCASNWFALQAILIIATVRQSLVPDAKARHEVLFPERCRTLATLNFDIIITDISIL